MAADHEPHVVTDTGADDEGCPHADAAAGNGRLAADAAADADGDTLATLRHVWLASDDGSGAASILAATVPLSPAQQEQIVQRLLHDLGRAGVQRASAVVSSGTRAPAPRRLALWPLAAACALCCWMAAHASSPGGAPGSARGGPVGSVAEQRPRVAAQARHEHHDQTTKAARALHLHAGEELTELAELYARQQRFEEAEALFQRALSERERRLGPAHKEVAATLTRLATLYQSQHQYAKAEPLYVRAFEIDPPFAVF
jgi:tetratricopeptide (TPR) repeat protein